jgi:hypothetical protein
MKCWYCNGYNFIIHEYVGLLKMGICKNCKRSTIETDDNTGIPYQVYSKCGVNDISEQIVSKWNDYRHFKLTLVTNEKTGETKLDIYYPYEGRLQGERIETLAFGNGLNVSTDRLITKNIELRNEIKEKVKNHYNSWFYTFYRLISPLKKIPEYKIYEQNGEQL